MILRARAAFFTCLLGVSACAAPAIPGPGDQGNRVPIVQGTNGPAAPDGLAGGDMGEGGANGGMGNGGGVAAGGGPAIP